MFEGENREAAEEDCDVSGAAPAKQPWQKPQATVITPEKLPDAVRAELLRKAAEKKKK